MKKTDKSEYIEVKPEDRKNTIIASVLDWLIAIAIGVLVGVLLLLELPLVVRGGDFPDEAEDLLGGKLGPCRLLGHGAVDAEVGAEGAGNVEVAGLHRDHLLQEGIDLRHGAPLGRKSGTAIGRTPLSL